MFVTPKDIPTIIHCFSDPEYYSPPADVIASEIARDCRGHFNSIHISSGLKADLDPGNRDKTFAWAWLHRLTEETPHGPIHIAHVEYIILWKMIFYQEGKSEKHLRDIQRILNMQPCLTHQGFLEENIMVHSLGAIWTQFTKPIS